MEDKEELVRLWYVVGEPIRHLSNELLQEHDPRHVSVSLAIMLIVLMKSQDTDREELIKEISKLVHYIYDSNP